jgi:pyrimidine operon attenuation protein/uracil phosphoribosyltransferase
MPTNPVLTQPLLDESATKDLLPELARQISQTVPPAAHLVLVGIRRRGDSIAESIGEHLRSIRGTLSIGSLDITLYRDDFGQIDSLPRVGTTIIDSSIDGAYVVVVDDVLYTGRTIRAALNELTDFGRATKIELCVLVDRGGRQLPIQPDYVGHFVKVDPGQEISVRVPALDGAWGVDLVDRSAVVVDPSEVGEG